MLRRNNPESDPLQRVINQMCLEMLEEQPGTEEYVKMADQLNKLLKQQESRLPKQIDRNTLILVAGNLAGIVLILAYEKAGVITSRAIGFVLKVSR